MILLPLLFAVIAEDEAELVRRLQKRDPQALGELYDKYGRLAFSLIYRIVRDVGTAEDLVQETFLRVWNRSQGFDGERGRARRMAAGGGAQSRDRLPALGRRQKCAMPWNWRRRNILRSIWISKKRS